MSQFQRWSDAEIDTELALSKNDIHNNLADAQKLIHSLHGPTQWSDRYFNMARSGQQAVRALTLEKERREHLRQVAHSTAQRPQRRQRVDDDDHAFGAAGEFNAAGEPVNLLHSWYDGRSWWRIEPVGSGRGFVYAAVHHIDPSQIVPQPGPYYCEDLGNRKVVDSVFGLPMPTYRDESLRMIQPVFDIHIKQPINWLLRSQLPARHTTEHLGASGRFNAAGEFDHLSGDQIYNEIQTIENTKNALRRSIYTGPGQTYTQKDIDDYFEQLRILEARRNSLLQEATKRWNEAQTARLIFAELPFNNL